ncbi:hypothetical protein [Thiohalospira sp.]|uniref:hypothetical protein n=1 Tax=Thiohalospira sp. TaxID=3080549 RepID=UPI00397EE055
MDFYRKKRIAVILGGVWGGVSAAAIIAQYFLLFFRDMPNLELALEKASSGNISETVNSLITDIVVTLSVWVFLYFVFLGITIYLVGKCQFGDK